MKYEKGTFTIVPNLDKLVGLPAEAQSIYLWLCKYSDEDGICFPSRNKIAKNISSSVRTVDKYLSILVEKNIILKTIRRKAGSKENMTNVYQLVIGEIALPSENDALPPSAPNDTVTISRDVTISTEEDTSIQNKITLNPAQGKSPVSRLQSLYGLLFKTLYGFKPKPTTYPQTGGVFKQLLKDYSEIQIACLLIVFFNWQGMNDRETKEKDWLIGQTHSIYLFKGSVSKYEAYARNVAGWSEEFDNDEKMYRIVKGKIIELSTAR